MTETARIPTIAMFVSDEATFETYPNRLGGVLLVMRPHGVKKGSAKEVGWNLTWGEVEDLRTLLAETVGDSEP